MLTQYKILTVSLLRSIVFGIFFCFSQAYADPSAEEAFTMIYENKVWGTNEDGGVCGSGSTLAATAAYRSFLQGFITDYHIKSVVDFGCGDWAFSQTINWEGVDYLGLDVVKAIIEKNQLKFSSPNICFIHADGLTTDLPAADLLICKEVLQHLTNEDVMRFAQQLDKFKYCLITNDVDPGTQTCENQNIDRGGSRWIDLTKPPFNICAHKAFSYREQGNFKQVLLINNPDASVIGRNSSP